MNRTPTNPEQATNPAFPATLGGGISNDCMEALMSPLPLDCPALQDFRAFREHCEPTQEVSDFEIEALPQEWLQARYQFPGRPRVAITFQGNDRVSFVGQDLNDHWLTSRKGAQLHTTLAEAEAALAEHGLFRPKN